MALHLLNPGLRPLGLFDLQDGVELEGGEYVGIAVQSGESASDSANQGPLNAALTTGIMVELAASAAGSFGGLADEGGDEYGTLFGSLIGQNAGRATAFGTGAGAVVIGPLTTSGSGKATVWATPGLYGISGAAQTVALLAAENGDAVASDADGLFTAAVTTTNVGYCLGHMTDTSLVSTTTTAVGEDAEATHSVIYFTGVNQA